MPKAIALLSGGLDSTLAVLVLSNLGVEVTAVTFLTQFGCDITDRSSCGHNPFPAAEKFGFNVKICHLADKFLDIVKNPVHGHGRNMNPCIDCRILMLREAKELMTLAGADFLVTGEVLGQRPMSQRRDSFPLIDREAGVEGIVLRPLSAKCLKPTIPELEGLIDREKLYGFAGRSRKPQMALDHELGLTDYPSPAGGCLLTDPIYAWRLRELLEHRPDPEEREISLLRVGRHFRLDRVAKLVIGRNQKENETITALAAEDDILLFVENVGSPTSVFVGEPSADLLKTASALTLRYSAARHLPSEKVTTETGDGRPLSLIEVQPAGESLLHSFRIVPAPGGGGRKRSRGGRRNRTSGKFALKAAKPV